MAGAPSFQIHECFRIPHERIYEQRDNLSHGPLAPLNDPGHWQSLRRAFWQQIPGSAPVNSGDDPDPSALYHRLVSDRKRVRSAERLFLWLGSTLAEQLMLAWLLKVFKKLEVGTEGLRLLGLRPRQGKIDRSIGILNCELLKELTQWRRPNTDELGAYKTAWHAVSSPSPDVLIDFCALDMPQASPGVEALRAYMTHYPAVGSGLNTGDKSILENCDVRPRKAARIVASTLVNMRQTPDWPGDVYLFERLKRLGDRRLSHPLIKIIGTGASMRHTEVVITATGCSVLEGEASFVELNGIDDWVGGVHLSSREGTLWFYDGETVVPG